jgi:hypothetical protein
MVNTGVAYTKRKTNTFGLCNVIYEGESVNRSQMAITRKTSEIRTWKKHVFSDISSTNIDTLVPSLYHCVETRSIEVFWLSSQPLSHLCFNLFVISETFATKVVFLAGQTNESHYEPSSGCKKKFSL